MSQIINTENIDEYRDKLESNYEDSIKATALNLIETGYSFLLESNKFSEDMLDNIATKVVEDDECNDYIDSTIRDEIIACIEENEIENVEEMEDEI